MCIVTWTTSHPDYALILASNRDEFLHRSTEDACWRDANLEPVQDQRDGVVLCGRDASAGGTWFAMGADGRLGALTNFTEPAPSLPPTASRGSLLVSFLKSLASPHDFLGSIASTIVSFAAFNLLLLSVAPISTPLSFENGRSVAPAEVGYISNRGSCAPELVLDDPNQIAAGLSNSLLSQPWPKVIDARHGLQLQMEKEKKSGQKWSPQRWELELAAVMSHAIPLVSRESFKSSVRISPIMIPYLSEGSTRWYATRLLTTLLITRDGRYRFVENDVWRLDSQGQPALATGGPGRVFEGSLRAAA